MLCGLRGRDDVRELDAGTMGFEKVLFEPDYPEGITGYLMERAVFCL